MSDELTIPGTNDLCKFVEAYFADSGYTRDDKSKANHVVYRIPQHERNISVPKNYKRLRKRTFFDLLEDIGITANDYRQLAGTPKKLKAYIKERRRKVKP